MRFVLLFALTGCVVTGPEVEPTPTGTVPPPTMPCTNTYYTDADGDGYPTGNPVVACEAPPGTVETFDGVDCDDMDASIHPGAEEQCDDVDHDCDGSPDAGLEIFAWYADLDGDGFGSGAAAYACGAPSAHVLDAGDCDDANPDVAPGAPEHCDGVDEDCNGVPDDQPIDGFVYYADADEDGYGNAAAPVRVCEALHNPDLITQGGDCDDTDPAINPLGTESCNGADDDCNGVFDDGMQTATFWADPDGDGYGDPGISAEACVQPADYAPNADDCDSQDPAVHPGAPEWCDGIDNDCDGSVADEDDDLDGDGYTACTGDCDDAFAHVYPGAPELCDGIDDDCNLLVDEPWHDEHEPNDARTQAPVLTGDDSSVTVTGTVSGPDDDWFAMDTYDDPDLITEGDLFHAEATVIDLPPGVEARLHLYKEVAFGLISHVDEDGSWQDGVLSVANDGTWIGDDGNRYWVRLEIIAGYGCDARYSLTMLNEG